ncbi:MAG: hypothetical protein JXX28_09470 [Deltaproteobacteria bacterium]|nr:hypothetical protein [Deltaproteobacteria bacterium]
MKSCCPEMDLVWVQERDGEELADVLKCLACGQVHTKESWLAPVEYDASKSCVNCGGSRMRGAMPGTPGAECSHCGFTGEQDLHFHEHLKSSTPDLSFSEAAAVAFSAQRRILALKLATAAYRWDEEPERGLSLRVRVLAELGYEDEALDEAVRWVRLESTSQSFLGLAAVQLELGATKEAVQTLRYGMHLAPEDLTLPAALAETLVVVKDFPGALEAAGLCVEQGAPKPILKRALAVIKDIASRYYGNGQFEDAAAGARYAGKYQDRIPELAWIQAQVATFVPNDAEATRWANTVLRVDPTHQGALELLARLAIQEKKRGWLW